MGRESGGGAEREADAGERDDQHQIVSGGRDRVEVHLSNEEQDGQRDDDAAAIELPLTSLTGDDQDEHCVDEVIGECHGQHDLPISRSRRRLRG